MQTFMEEFRNLFERFILGFRDLIMRVDNEEHHATDEKHECIVL